MLFCLHMCSMLGNPYNTLKQGCVIMSMQQLNPVVVGNVIARFRIEKGLTQEVLSGLSDIGRTHLSAIERGERKPTLETLYRISNALGISMSTIVIAIEQELEKQKR